MKVDQKILQEATDKVIANLRKLRTVPTVSATDVNSEWDEIPLSFRQFVESPEHMNFTGLSERQLQITDFMFGPDGTKIFDNRHNLSVLMLGKSSGKNFTVKFCFCYMIYVLMCHKNPQKFLGSQKHEYVDFMNVAISGPQALRNFFDPFKQRILDWKWLREKYLIRMSGHNLNLVTEKERGPSDTVLITADGVIFPKLIRCISGNSQQEQKEGANLLAFVCDEIAGFKDSSKMSNASQVYRTLRQMAVSRFPTKFKAFLISFPRYKNDFICQAYDMYADKLDVYTDKAITWDVNPMYKQYETFDYKGYKVPVVFQEEFLMDSTDAERKYLCLPPDVETALFEDKIKLLKCVDQTIIPFLETEDYDITIGPKFLTRKRIIRWLRKPDPLVKYMICVDLGRSRCAAALSILHREGTQLVVDYSTRWMPDPAKHLEVDLLDVEQFINNISDKMNLDIIAFDQWNSASVILSLQSKGLPAEQVSLSHVDYKAFKYFVNAGNLRLINFAPLINEIQNIKDIAGTEIDSDEFMDLADTIVTGVKILFKLAKSKNVKHLPSLEGELIGFNLNSEGARFTGDTDAEPDDAEDVEDPYKTLLTERKMMLSMMEK
jgi:hypothetical protein